MASQEQDQIPPILLRPARDRFFGKDKFKIQKYERDDITPPPVKVHNGTKTKEGLKLEEIEDELDERSMVLGLKSKTIIELSYPKNLSEVKSTLELAMEGNRFYLPASQRTSGTITPVMTSGNKSVKSLAHDKKSTIVPSRAKFGRRVKSRKLTSNKAKSKTCLQAGQGLKFAWTTRSPGACADQALPIKRFSKLPPKMPRLILFEYLRTWDVSSPFRRHELIRHFLKNYVSVDPLDFDYYLSRGGTLLFSRFTIGMQIAFQRKRSVWLYFQALGVFIKSLQGERFMYEFLMMGGLETAFEVIRVDEMGAQDKINVFDFLSRLIDGHGGDRVKKYICRDSSALESVVDCLTMCKNRNVIKFARIYLQNMCTGNSIANIQMISKYIISMLTCDFNPPLQQMACQVLPFIVHQDPDTARRCYNHVVDVLRTEFEELLVDAGDLGIAIMETPMAEEFLAALNAIAQPTFLTDDLSLEPEIYTPESALVQTAQADSDTEDTSAADALAKAELPERRTPNHDDASIRQQKGALYVLTYMLKNRIELADWMVEQGLIGSLLAALGTCAQTGVQLTAIRLLLLINELSPDCSVSLSFLLPKKLYDVIVENEEGCLAYLTALICAALRRLGRIVQRDWLEWFYKVVLPEENDSDEEEEEEILAVVAEVAALKEYMESLIGDEFLSIIDKMEVPIPDPELFSKRSDDKPRRTSRLGLIKAPISPGENRILQDDDLEPFRKYLHQDSVTPDSQDELEQFYAAKYTDDKDYDLGGMEMVRLREAEKAMAAFQNQTGLGFGSSLKNPSDEEEEPENATGSLKLGSQVSETNILPEAPPSEPNPIQTIQI